jgi:hypothetical protein
MVVNLCFGFPRPLTRAPIVYATSSVVCTPFRARAIEFARAVRFGKVQSPHDVLGLLAEGERTPLFGTLASRAGFPASRAISTGRPV